VTSPGAKTLVCRTCGPMPLVASHCRVDLRTLEVRWACRHDFHRWATVRSIAERLVTAGATVAVSPLPDVAEREVRAFGLALKDSWPDELWAAIEATKP
jgi:hypothetical protein